MKNETRTSPVAEKVREQVLTNRLVGILGNDEAQRHVREFGGVARLVERVQREENGHA